MAFLSPIMTLGKTFMDPTGGKIIDQVLSTIPTVATAIGRNDMNTIYKTLDQVQTVLNGLPPHITQPQIRAVSVERIDGLGKVVNCVNRGKCGLQNYISYLFDCVTPFKTLMKSILGYSY